MAERFRLIWWFFHMDPYRGIPLKCHGNTFLYKTKVIKEKHLTTILDEHKTFKIAIFNPNFKKKSVMKMMIFTTFNGNTLLKC